MTKKYGTALFVVATIYASTFVHAQFGGVVDPGVRGGPPGAGGPLDGLTPSQQDYFQKTQATFEEVLPVTSGVGPRMNMDNCTSCHSQPATGGTSPAVNPEIAFAQQGADHIPSFLSADGPAREVRFVRNPDGSPDGGVHDLFTITGRSGADGCQLAQPDFEREAARHNVSFRIPTPVFGMGLIEMIPDGAIRDQATADLGLKRAFGIRGHENHRTEERVSGQINAGQDGTVTRFGWKAQNKSAHVFAAEALNVELGMTTEMFQTEREEDGRCQFTSVPNDLTNTDAGAPFDLMTRLERIAMFMRFLAPPAPSPDTPGGADSISRGSTLFDQTGCVLCHRRSYTTDAAGVLAMQHKTVELFSDLLVHDMGVGLADGVTQGAAGPQEFRTAPLWGLGQRIFFLHDGRTTNLVQAIRAHASEGSEANGVIARFDRLDAGQKQDLLNFLRSR